MDGQIRFMPNGNIAPCPFTEMCINHPEGCKGISYWCRRFDTAEQRRMMQKGYEKYGCKRVDKEIHGNVKRVISDQETGGVFDTGIGEAALVGRGYED